MPENAGKMQVSGKFQRGQSGNPNGKKKGTKNKATIVAEKLLQDDLDNICRRLIEVALIGNVQAIKLILDRVLPPNKDRFIDINLPKLNTSEDAVKAISTIIDAVSDGNITPNEGEAISRVINTFLKAIESQEIEKRVSILEQGIDKWRLQ